MNKLQRKKISNSQRRKRQTRKFIRIIMFIAVCAVLLASVPFIIYLVSSASSNHIAPSSEVTDTVINQPEKNTSDYLFSVCIDAGHGGKDNGCDYNMTRFEKNDVLSLALKVQANLESNHIKVIMTRDDDSFLKLSQRCQIANEANVDYMVSFHRNTGEGYGIESWIRSQANQETIDLATNILNALDNEKIQRNRGVKYGTQKDSSEDYYINAYTKMPTCIMEIGFLNNKVDNQLFDQHIDEYAQEISDAIITTHKQYSLAKN